MRNVLILLSVLLVVVLAVSCSQKVDEVLTTAPYVTTLADAKVAAADGKPILLDFFTDT